MFTQQQGSVCGHVGTRAAQQRRQLAVGLQPSKCAGSCCQVNRRTSSYRPSAQASTVLYLGGSSTSACEKMGVWTGQMLAVSPDQKGFHSSSL